jgi:hypothetical protein
MGKLIADTAAGIAALGEDDKPGPVIVAIMTDGMENSRDESSCSPSNRGSSSRLGVCREALQRPPPLRQITRMCQQGELAIELVVLIYEEAANRDRKCPIITVWRK